MPYLKASAYMVRSSKTEELILEIDAGIKKRSALAAASENDLLNLRRRLEAWEDVHVKS